MRWAWVSLVFYPCSFVAGFLGGLILVYLLGYAEDEPVPTAVVVGVNTVAYVIFALPGVFSVYFGQRAVRQGNRAGWLPAVVGVAVVLALIGLHLTGGAELP